MNGHNPCSFQLVYSGTASSLFWFNSFGPEILIEETGHSLSRQGPVEMCRPWRKLGRPFESGASTGNSGFRPLEWVLGSAGNGKLDILQRAWCTVASIPRFIFRLVSIRIVLE